MTEKAQRELYLALREACDIVRERDNPTDSYFIGVLAGALNRLLTAPQFRLSQLSAFDFIREVDRKWDSDLK